MKTIFSVAISISLVACGSGAGNNGDDDGVDANTNHPDGHDGPHDGPTTTPHLTVFTIVLENHDYHEIVGSTHAPYINSLIAQGALATNYKDTNHPSLPNYLHMISGADQYPGYIDVDPTFLWFPADQPNLGTQLEAAHIKWRSYQESMVTPCLLTATSDGLYAPKHDPFLYFKDQQVSGSCADTNVDYSNFAADLATDTYRYMWITPNLTSDGHDPATDPVGSLTTSDTWLSVEVPKIIASDAYNAGGIIFITWDEAEGRTDADLIPMIVVSKKVKMPGMQMSSLVDHGAYLATVEDLFGLPRLATVSGSPNLMEVLNQ